MSCSGQASIKEVEVYGAVSGKFKQGKAWQSDKSCPSTSTPIGARHRSGSGNAITERGQGFNPVAVARYSGSQCGASFLPNFPFNADADTGHRFGCTAWAPVNYIVRQLNSTSVCQSKASCPSAFGEPSCLAGLGMREWLFMRRLYVPRLAWAACPSAVGLLAKLAKALHAIALWAARPPAVSARASE